MRDSEGHGKGLCGVGTTAKSHQKSGGRAEEIAHGVNKVLALLTGGPDSMESLVYHPGHSFRSE